VEIRIRSLVGVACAIVLTACGGGGDGSSAPAPSTPAPTYAVGGTASGLASGASVVLQNNGGGDLTVSANGTFTFGAALASGAAYSVSVKTQPTNQQCTVASGSGTVGSAAVTGVAVSCVSTAPVTGGINGLTGAGLVLQLNGGNDLAPSGNTFSFTQQLALGATALVTVKTQPTGQHCTGVTIVVGQQSLVAPTVTCGPQVGKYLYVPNNASNDVSAYAINGDTGALSPVAGSPFPAGHAAPSLSSIDPAGKYLYVTGRGSSTEPPRASVFAVNAGTGGLTAVTGSPFDLSHNPTPPNGAVTGTFRPLLHPSGAFGYTATIPGDRLYGATLDATTGALTEITGFPVIVGFGVGNSTFNASGSRFYVPQNSIGGTPGSGGGVTAFAVSAPSGALTPIASSYPTGGNAPTFAALSPDGHVLVVANGASGSVASYLVDATTGALTAAPGSPFSTGAPTNIVTNLAWHPTKNFVYAVNSNTSPTISTIAAFQVDTTTGALTAVTGSPFSTGGELALLATIEPTGKYFIISNRNTSSIASLAIDATTGTLTHVTGSPFATPGTPAGVTLDPSGRYLYVANTNTGNVTSWSLNLATGALTVVNTVNAGTTPSYGTVAGLQ
jgi:6-phosphogluconolactonase (cycloisomerase 2 family)